MSFDGNETRAAAADAWTQRVPFRGRQRQASLRALTGASCWPPSASVPAARPRCAAAVLGLVGSRVSRVAEPARDGGGHGRAAAGRGKLQCQSLWHCAAGRRAASAIWRREDLGARQPA
jgi:hypothetical protein